MNVNEAIEFVERYGWSVYNPSRQKYLNVWSNHNKFVGTYSYREFIHLAKSIHSNHWKPSSTSKAAVGVGGRNCPCCTKAPPTELKAWDRKGWRRKGKMEVERELMEV